MSYLEGWADYTCLVTKGPLFSAPPSSHECGSRVQVFPVGASAAPCLDLSVGRDHLFTPLTQGGSNSSLGHVPLSEMDTGLLTEAGFCVYLHKCVYRDYFVSSLQDLDFCCRIGDLHSQG